MKTRTHLLDRLWSAALATAATAMLVAAMPSADAAMPAAPAGAQEAARPALTLERLMAETTKHISGLRWLDDTHLVGDLKADNATAQTVWPLDGGKPRQLAPGEGGRVSPDGKMLITREKDAWVVRSLHGDQRELARVPEAYGDNPRGLVAWSRDSQQIALVQETRSVAVPPSIIAKEGGVRYEDVGVYADAKDAAGIAISTLTVLDLRKPEALQRYPHAGVLQSLEWGAADNLYFIVQPYWNTGGKALTTVVRVLQGGEQREVLRFGGIMQSLQPLVSPDGRWMAVVADVDDQMWDDFCSLLVVDLGSGKQRRLTQDKYVSRSVRWAPDSKALYFTVRDGGWTQLYRSDLEGNMAAITDTPVYKEQMQLSPNGRQLAYMALNGSGLAELRVTDVKVGHDRQVALVDDPGTRYRLGKFERVKFPTPDGLNIAAWVIYPPDFDPAKKYPMYIDVHGGGPSSFLYMFAPLSGAVAFGPLEWHTWATRGYLVFVPDYRSSGEYGPGVAAARYRDGDFNSMEADMRDIDAGTTWMLQHPYVDANRIAVLGSSAGGARVNLLLTRSTRYRAGVMHDAVGAGVLADYFGSTTGERAGTKGTQGYWNFYVGEFAANQQKYLSGFLFDGYKSTTPTLILVGGNRNAGALHPLSAEVLFSQLRRKGVPARMLRYTDDGHGFLTAASSTHAIKEVASWLATHMNMATDDQGNIIFEGGRVKDAKPPVAGQ